MVDILSKKKRSQLMAKITGKETEPEILVRKYLFSKGFRFRKNDKRYPGTPDIVLPKYDTAIFVHGCFWHGHSCRAGRLPSSNKKYWNAKIAENRARDKKKKRLLRKAGWKVIEIWQCKLRNKRIFSKTLDKVINSLK